MKKILWAILRASLLTLASYLLLYVVFALILSIFDDHEVLRSVIMALMSTAVFGALLLYVAKIRSRDGEKEVLEDYRESKYTSCIEDLKRTVRREGRMLITIAALVMLSYLLNTVDLLLFGKKVLSFPTLPFAPLCLFSSVVPISVLGYAASALLDVLAYLGFLLIYRKRKYNYWMKHTQG